MGTLPVYQLLPHPTTVSRGVKTKAAKVRGEMGPKICQAFRETGGSVTFDLWTEDHKKISYVGLTTHYCCDGKVIASSPFELCGN